MCSSDLALQPALDQGIRDVHGHSLRALVERTQDKTLPLSGVALLRRAHKRLLQATLALRSGSGGVILLLGGLCGSGVSCKLPCLVSVNSSDTRVDATTVLRPCRPRHVFPRLSSGDSKCGQLRKGVSMNVSSLPSHSGTEMEQWLHN